MTVTVTNQRWAANFHRDPAEFGRRDDADGIDGHVFVQVPRERAVEMPGGVRPFGNGVGAVGVRHHGEMLIVSDEFVDQPFRALVMAVVVARAMDQEQISPELAGIRDGRAKAVIFGIVLGQPHVTLLVDRIVEQLACVRSDGYRCGIHVRVAENGVEAHAATAAPAPHANPSRVRVRPALQQGTHSRRLILRCENPHLPIRNCARRAPAEPACRGFQCWQRCSPAAPASNATAPSPPATRRARSGLAAHHMYRSAMDTSRMDPSPAA